MLVGPPDSGKSELSMALMALGARLVADDQVLLDGTTARCPPRTQGLIHLRGRKDPNREDRILRVPFLDKTVISIIFQSPDPAAPLSRPPQTLVDAGIGVHILPFKDDTTPARIKALILAMANP